MKVVAVIDSRSISPVMGIQGAEIFMGTDVVDTKGRRALKSIKLSNGKTIDTDSLAVSGGWNPNLHLTCHHRGIPNWNEEHCLFCPDDKRLRECRLQEEQKELWFSLMQLRRHMI